MQIILYDNMTLIFNISHQHTHRDVQNKHAVAKTALPSTINAQIATARTESNVDNDELMYMY